MYYLSQYTCFDDHFLCPVVNGERYIRCGDACYSTSQYSCAGTVLQPYSPTGPSTTQNCSGSQFDPSQWVCLDGYYLCPIKNGVATLRCGEICYDSSKSSCAIGQVYPIGTPAPTCVGLFGASEYCIDVGCIQAPCCEGLWSSGGRCRSL
ncbi:hypothetical protein B0H13DRAFT_2034445 [Mycena leptocephala]|nr:hypothetical protein B0H13DRAFT_2034445 [Mycena leptocephala]